MTLHLINGHIYQGQGQFTTGLSIQDGIIIDCGDLNISESDTVIDLKGQTVIPGFNDSHLHLAYTGLTMGIAELNGAQSVEEIIEIMRSFHQSHPNSKVLYGIGYNQEHFPTQTMTRHDLDRITTEIPVILRRVCGHVVTTNSKVFELIDTTQAIEGGSVEVEQGRFNENAIELVETLLPKETLQIIQANILKAVEYAISVGITSVGSNDATDSDNSNVFEALHQLVSTNRLKVRYSGQTNYQKLDDFKQYLNTEFLNTDDYNEKTFRKGSLKLYKDGTLGARTAHMINDYADDPGNRGIEVLSNDQMIEFVKLATQHQIQVITHAIGDQANQDVIDIYHKYGGQGNPLRHGIVHAQITNVNQIKQMVDHQILVLAQPLFLDADVSILENRVGEDLAMSSYAFGSMIKQGVKISFSSDAPVEDMNPFNNIYSAVTRKRFSDKQSIAYNPKEACSVMEAIDAYTYGSAYNESTEHFKGLLKEDYVADLIVLDRDIFDIEEDDILNVSVLKTMINGEFVYHTTNNGCAF